ncbi:hypothetical protein P692DRAFT_20705709, partial [Suillus brevipes Sb2]
RVAVDIDRLEACAVLPKQRDAIAFTCALQNVSLNDPSAKLSEEALFQLRNPLQEPLAIDEAAIQHGISTYFALEHSAVAAYERIRKSGAQCFGDAAADVPSYARIERLIAEYTGVESIEHDMCPSTCIAYTGPFANLNCCLLCNREHYNPVKLHTSGGQNRVPCQKFITIPLAAQLQALWRDPEHAQKMSYLPDTTTQLLEELRTNHGEFAKTDDFIMGSDYIHAVLQNDINPKNDIVLMILMDGVQLYESKQSDCWIYIWVVLNHAPGDRYKKKYILPGGFIPGPNKPKNVDLFLLPGMHHLSALQKEGLHIWDA